MKLYNGKLPKEIACGSVSHGSMRPEDVWSACRYLLPKRNTKKATFINEGDKLFQFVISYEGDKLQETTEYERFNQIVFEDMFDYLNEVAPKGMYFGAHIGDGSDYGFWSDEDLM